MTDQMNYGMQQRPEAPMFKDYIPIVKDAVGPGSRRTYGTYWNRVLQHWGDRQLDEITPVDIIALMQTLKANRPQRRNGRDGRSTEELFLSALRCLYRLAVSDGHVTTQPAL